MDFDVSFRLTFTSSEGMDEQRIRKQIRETIQHSVAREVVELTDMASDTHVQISAVDVELVTV